MSSDDQSKPTSEEERLMRLLRLHSVEELNEVLSQPEDEEALRRSEPPYEEYDLADRQAEEEELTEQREIEERQRQLEPLPVKPAIVAAILLFVAATTKVSYEFYSLMRLVVCPICVYMAVKAYRKRFFFWFGLLLVVGLTFNPLHPRFSVDAWRILDLFGSCALLLWALFAKKWNG